MAASLEVPEAAAVSGGVDAQPGLPLRAHSEGQAAAAVAATAAPSSEAMPSLRQVPPGVKEVDLETAAGGDDEKPLPERGAASSRRGLSTRTASVGTLATTVNLASVILGTSILTAPYVFGQLGWFSIVALLAMGGVTAYTAVLIGRCASTALSMALEKDCRAADWPSIGSAAFGQVGRAVVTTVLSSEIFFIMVASLVINGSALQALFPSCSKNLLIRLSGCASLALTFCPQKFLSYFPSLGPLAMVLVVALMAATGCALPERPAGDSYELLQPAAISLAMGSFLFGFGSHCSIPSIYATMERKARFPLAVVAAFGACTAVFIAAGVLGYYFFAGSLQKDVLDNVGRDLALAPLPGLRWMPLLCSGALALKLQATFPLLVAPIVDVGEGLLENLAVAERMPRTLRTLLRLCLLAVVTALAELLQDHALACVALTGSLFGSCHGLIFPALFYHRLHGKQASRAQACLLGAIGLGGVYFMATGAYSAIGEIVGA